MSDTVTILKQKLSILETEYHKSITDLQTAQANINKITGKIEVLIQLLKEIAPDEQINLKNVAVKSTGNTTENSNLKLA